MTNWTGLFYHKQPSNLVLVYKDISHKFEDSSIYNIDNIIKFCIEKEICIPLMLKLNDFLKLFKLSHNVDDIISITIYFYEYDDEECVDIFLKSCMFELNENSFCYELDNNYYTGISYSKFDYYIKNYKKIALLV